MWNYTFCIFFSFIRKLYWNKQAAAVAVAAHNKFAQYFFLSHSSPIFSFQKRNKQQPSERFFFRSTVIVCIKIYIFCMYEWVKLYEWMLLCVWDFFLCCCCWLVPFKVFFFDIIFFLIVCDRSQKCELDRNSHICDDIAEK